jgi:hypothetical protein
MRDMLNNITPRRAISPAAAGTDNTAFVSQIIDTQGFDSLTFLILTGALADVDATFAVTMDHGDVANLSDAAAVPADQLIGTLALAGFTFAADDATRKIGYRGSRRYVRMTITPSANTGNAFVAAVALLGHPLQAPTANPPA